MTSLVNITYSRILKVLRVLKYKCHKFPKNLKIFVKYNIFAFHVIAKLYVILVADVVFA